MSEYYKIKTVGDLINELNKFDKDMPIKKSEIIPMKIATVVTQDCHEYGSGGTIKSTYKAVVIQ